MNPDLSQIDPPDEDNERRLIVYEATPIFVTAPRIAEWLGIGYSGAAKIIYRGDLGPWAKIGRKLVVRTESMIEAIQRIEQRGWARPKPLLPKADPAIMKFLMRPKVRKATKKEVAEALKPLPERQEGKPRTAMPEPDKTTSALVNREIQLKEYVRLLDDRKAGKRIHEAICNSKVAMAKSARKDGSPSGAAADQQL